MLKDGNEESKWRAARVIVQVAFGNSETSTKLADLHVIKHAGGFLKEADNCTNRLKEALLQLVCNVASNYWYVFMCIYIYIYIYICMYACMYVYVYMLYTKLMACM